MSTTHSAMAIFSDLLVPSPPGAEGALKDIVRAKLDDMGWAWEIDPAGNLLVRVESANPEAGRVCLAAHLDEIAMVVTRIGPEGDLEVDRLGELLPWKLGEGPVELHGDHSVVTAVLSMGSAHTAGSADRLIRWEDCRLLTGLAPAELEKAGIRPGTFALPVRERRGPVVFGDASDPLVGAWTFDDRIGVVTLLRLLARIRDGKLQPAFSLVVAFTVREEVGGHGAKALVLREQPEVFIAVDGSPMPPETDLRLDGRPGIWVKDHLGPYDPGLVKALMAAAGRAGTVLQPVVFKDAASDASLAAYSAGITRIACVGHVRANSHGFEVLRLSVLDHLLDTLSAFVSDWEG